MCVCACLYKSEFVRVSAFFLTGMRVYMLLLPEDATKACVSDSMIGNLEIIRMPLSITCIRGPKMGGVTGSAW